MQFIRRHKLFTLLLALLLILAAGVIAWLHHAYRRVDYLPDGIPKSTAATKPAELFQEDPDADDITDLTVDEAASNALLDADDRIRKNLDDSKIWSSDRVFNVLLLGYDYGSKTYPYGRSDAMIVVSVNRTARKVQLISLSRAAYVAIPGYSNTRLSHAHGYGGPRLAIQTVEQNYKFRIDQFIACSFDAFQAIIDTLGGVNITLTEKEAAVLRAHFSGFSGAGTYALNGAQALLYVRTRKIDTDRDRTGRQRKLLLALAEQAKRMSASQLMALLDEVLPLVQTDFSQKALLRQVTNGMSALRFDCVQAVVPTKPTKLVLRDDFEVMLLDWGYEIDRLHETMYQDVIPDYEEAP